MSKENYLDKLLDGTAVKYMPVGQIISRVRDKGKSNHDIRTVYSVSNTHGLVKAEDFRNNTIHSEDTSNYTIVQPGMFAYNPSRLNIGSIAFLKTDMAGLVSPMYVVFSVDENVVTHDYLNLFIKSSYCKNKINSLMEEGARLRFDFERWNLIDAPIPPIEVQTKIVRILDAFTSITAELISELNLRKKQYSYYRDKLLSFEDGGAEWMALGEIGEFIRGKRFTKKDYVEEGGINAIHYGEIYTHYGTSSTSTISQVRSDFAESLRYAATNDVIVASVGETIEDVGKAVAWLGNGKVAIHDDSYAIRHSLNPKYLSYCLQTEDFISEKAKHVSRGKVKRLLIDGISKIRIPIPYPSDLKKSLAEQDRIVTILDKFDTLTNSISEGLPHEIELRQKQYEYYRDLLLNYPKPDTEVAA